MLSSVQSGSHFTSPSSIIKFESRPTSTITQQKTTTQNKNGDNDTENATHLPYLGVPPGWGSGKISIPLALRERGTGAQIVITTRSHCFTLITKSDT